VTNIKRQRVLGIVGACAYIPTTARPVNCDCQYIEFEEGIHTVDPLVGGILFAGKLGLDLEGMCSKVITLSLQQVCRKVCGPVSVVKVQCSTKGRAWNTPQHTLADDVSPAWLSLVDCIVEELVKEQVLEIGVSAEGLGDVLEEDGTDDATTTPHESDFWHVELPVILFRSSTDEHKALSVRDDLGSIQSLLQVGEELGLVTREVWSWTRADLGGFDALVLFGRETTSKDSFTDKSHGLAEIQSIHSSPLASSLLAGFVENLFQEWLNGQQRIYVQRILAWPSSSVKYI
jgi:hypothetical protein